MRKASQLPGILLAAEVTAFSFPNTVMRKDSVPAASQVVELSKAILTEDFPGVCLTLLAPSIPRGFPEVSFLFLLPYVHLPYISTRSEPHWHLWRVSL